MWSLHHLIDITWVPSHQLGLRHGAISKLQPGGRRFKRVEKQSSVQVEMPVAEPMDEDSSSRPF